MRVATGEPVLALSPAVLSESLRHELHLLADVDAGVLIEDKAHSIAVHYRLAPERETFLKLAVKEIVASEPNANLEFLLGKQVIDIKPKHFSKGSAVRDLMRRKPFAGRKPLFVGDDTTDESVFAILPEFNGMSFSVGRRAANTVSKVDAPKDVCAWVERIAAL